MVSPDAEIHRLPTVRAVPRMPAPGPRRCGTDPGSACSAPGRDPVSTATEFVPFGGAALERADQAIGEGVRRRELVGLSARAGGILVQPKGAVFITPEPHIDLAARPLEELRGRDLTQAAAADPGAARARRSRRLDVFAQESPLPGRELRGPRTSRATPDPRLAGQAIDKEVIVVACPQESLVLGPAEGAYPGTGDRVTIDVAPRGAKLIAPGYGRPGTPVAATRTVAIRGRAATLPETATALPDHSCRFRIASRRWCRMRTIKMPPVRIV